MILQQPNKRIWPVFLHNYEAAQPPLYYIVAGAWWRVGQSLHLTGPALLFWLRFMNILVVTGIVWLAYAAARLLFPNNLFIRLGVPALAAVFPQSVFYTIQNDIFSPLWFGTAFILLIKWARTAIPSVPLGATAGLALAAMFQMKISNLPFLVVSGTFVGWHVWRLARRGKLSSATQSLIALIISSALPIALWLIHTKAAFWRFYRTARQDAYSDLDDKAISNVVASPNFYPPGRLEVYCGPAFEILAGRNDLACRKAWLPCGGSGLRDVDLHFSWRVCRRLV
jgi:hypothetical protein